MELVQYTYIIIKRLTPIQNGIEVGGTFKYTPFPKKETNEEINEIAQNNARFANPDFQSKEVAIHSAADAFGFLDNYLFINAAIVDSYSAGFNRYDQKNFGEINCYR